MVRKDSEYGILKIKIFKKVVDELKINESEKKFVVSDLK